MINRPRQMINAGRMSTQRRISNNVYHDKNMQSQLDVIKRASVGGRNSSSTAMNSRNGSTLPISGALSPRKMIASSSFLPTSASALKSQERISAAGSSMLIRPGVLQDGGYPTQFSLNNFKNMNFKMNVACTLNKPNPRVRKGNEGA